MLHFRMFANENKLTIINEKPRTITKVKGTFNYRYFVLLIQMHKDYLHVLQTELCCYENKNFSSVEFTLNKYFTVHFF